MISTKMLITKKYHVSSMLPFRLIILLLLCIIFCIIHTKVVSSLSPSLTRRSHVNNGLCCHSTSIFQPNICNCQVNRRSYCNYYLQRRKHSVVSKTILYDSISKEQEQSPFYYIRNAVYSDLGEVANILIESFYNPSMLVRQYMYLSELSRLQGNFPYGDVEHSFFIACLKQPKKSDPSSRTIGGNNYRKDIIIGFVDVDARPGTKESDAPRPYLSDLAVLPSYRRKGVAQALIHECETEAKLWGKEELYLRVESKNDGALDMYKNKLGYEALDHHYFGVKDTTILLRRQFEEGKEENIQVETGEVTFII